MTMTEDEIADDAFLMENGIDPDSLLPDLLVFLERELVKSKSLYDQRDRAIETATNQIKAELTVKKTHKC